MQLSSGPSVVFQSGCSLDFGLLHHLDFLVQSCSCRFAAVLGLSVPFHGTVWFKLLLLDRWTHICNSRIFVLVKRDQRLEVPRSCGCRTSPNPTPQMCLTVNTRYLWWYSLFGAEHYGQTSSRWCDLSKGCCSRTIVNVFHMWMILLTVQWWTSNYLKLNLYSLLMSSFLGFVLTRTWRLHTCKLPKLLLFYRSSHLLMMS